MDANSGSPLATIHLPEPGSFGVGATVVDSVGQPLAFLMTGEKERQHGSSKSSYKIYSPATFVRRPGARPSDPRRHSTPRGSRQLPLGHRHSPALHKRDQGDGRPRRPPGKRIQVHGLPAAFVQVHADRRHGRHVVRENSDKRHDVRVANGADALLAICIMFAKELADDELERD